MPALPDALPPEPPLALAPAKPPPPARSVVPEPLQPAAMPSMQVMVKYLCMAEITAETEPNDARAKIS